MPFVQLTGVGISFGVREILNNVHLKISTGSRIALTGTNGSGKSTLMKIAAGLSEQDTGTVTWSKGAQTGYLPQTSLVHSGKTLLEEAQTAFQTLSELEEEASKITRQLENEKASTKILLSRYQEIQDTLESSRWGERSIQISQVLAGLGFSQSDYSRTVDKFSSGWQMRIGLSKILLAQPDILLLDEPTNYLDLESREWLQNFIKKYPGGVMLVSHDRTFLDDTCTQIAEILTPQLKIYKGNYSHYEVFRKKELESLVERWKRQQEEIEKIELFINRFRYTKTKASQVQSRIKMLEKMNRITIPAALKRIKISFPEAPRSGRVALRGEGLGRFYNNQPVFTDLDLELPRGSRTAVVGMNGAGKSTLLRIAAGEDTDFEGRFILGQNVVRGYFSQDQKIMLNLENTVLEEAGRGKQVGEPRLRTILGAFLFSSEDIYKNVSVLSGGERSRLALLRILLSPINLLILDEPTNHLDLTSKDILLEALKAFGGTLIIVSHDRYFLENIADNVIEIKNKTVRLFPGTYAYYRWKKEAESESSSDSPNKRDSSSNKTSVNNTSTAHEQDKNRRNRIKKLKREEERLASLLEEQEQTTAQLYAKLEHPENYSNPIRAQEISAQIKTMEQQASDTSVEWEKTATELEEILGH